MKQWTLHYCPFSGGKLAAHQLKHVLYCLFQSDSCPSARGKKGPSHTPKQHKDRGIDFYFSKSKNL